MEIKIDDKTNIQIDDSLRTKCEVWSRPCGYLRPKSLYNSGKKQEVEERKKFNVTEIFEKNNFKGIILGNDTPQNNTILGTKTPQNQNGGDK